MSAFRPESYAEALSLAQNRPVRPRSALRRVSLDRPPKARQSVAMARDTVPKKRAAKAKALSTGKLKKKVWKEFSVFIRTRRADAAGMTKCCTCPVIKHWKEMQAGHFLRGRLNANLFDERGVNEQCYACNVGRDGNVVEYYEWMLVNHGKAVIDELRQKNNVTHKWQPGELLGLLEKYKSINAANPLTKEQPMDEQRVREIAKENQWINQL